jgi:N-acetylneuraminic acid mutarotase
MRRGLLVPLVALPLAAIVVARDTVDVQPDSATTSASYAWVESTRRPALARTEVAGATLGDDVYVIGGFLPPRRTTAAVERLHLKRWSRVRSLPVPLNHAAAVGYRGHVYVLGGYAGRTGLTHPVKTLYRYEPRRNRWTRLPDMPTARAALALGAIDGRLYAVGGNDGSGQTAALEIYDIAERRWSRGPSFSAAREHLGGAVRRGRFYAVAGRNGPSGNLAIVEGYNPATRRWSRLPDMPKARGGNGAAVIGGRLVAIGGEEGGGTIAEVDLYDFAKHKWQRVDPMPTPRHGLAVVTRSDGRLWSVSGGPKPGLAFSNAVEILSRSAG